MSPARFSALAQKFPALRLAVIGDFCLDRYLEIDPTRRENAFSGASAADARLGKS